METTNETSHSSAIAGVQEIRVEYVDNELYILASDGKSSSELCHIKSGYDKDTKFTFYPPAILGPGNYDLTFIGINWGGPYKFTLQIDDAPPFGLESPENADSAQLRPGVVWQETISIMVTSLSRKD